MKKFTLILCLFLACVFQVKAQQFVSTEPSNRNVILEEFTGRTCGYCTDGHAIANAIMAANPDRVWAINVHAGGFSPTSYPNLNTPDGAAIDGGSGVTGYPAGMVNRSTTAAQSRNAWQGTCNTQMGQAAELNIAGQAVINPVTRLATITVEVYYTGNSAASTNYLSVAMLQDSILGSQSDYGNYNPSQWLNGQYVHMHALRDIITETWGDAITPTTQGTLITQTYTYEIPESIGSPNGVEVDLDNIFFLAWVSENTTNSPRKILSGCELATVQGADEPIYPFISGVSQENVVTCGHNKSFIMNITNGGTDELTSIDFEATIEDQKYTTTWTGNLSANQATNVEMSFDVPFGDYNVDFKIVSANGQPFDFTKSITATCDEWQDVDISGDEEELTIIINQDRFGNQITWKLYASDYSVIAEGGPYTMLMSNTTLMHIENAVVNNGECVKFVITDQVGNGMCCDYGEGYYQILDSQENIIIDGDGGFGSEASHILSIGEQAATGSVTTGLAIAIDEDRAILNATITSGNPIVAGFWYRAESETEYQHVHAEAVTPEFSVEITNLIPETNYLYKAFIKLDETSEPIFGEERTFITGFEGIDDFNENNCNIYPNPAYSMLYVNGVNMDKVMIYNSVGQLVNSVEVNANTVKIDVNSLESGVYFVRIMGENGSILTKKISIIH